MKPGKEGEDEVYAETKRLIEKQQTDGEVGDQANLKDSAVYIYGGTVDRSVPVNGPTEQKRYFEDMGAKVSFTMEEGQGHWFNTGSAASDMTKYCYETMGEEYTDKAYTAYDMGFVN